MTRFNKYRVGNIANSNISAKDKLAKVSAILNSKNPLVSICNAVGSSSVTFTRILSELSPTQ